LFLRDLHQHDLPPLDHLLDLVMAMLPRARPRGLFHLVFVAADCLDGKRRLYDDFDRRAFCCRRELGRVGALGRDFVAMAGFVMVMRKSVAVRRRCAVARFFDWYVDAHRRFGVLRESGGIGFVVVVVLAFAARFRIGDQIVDQAIFRHRLGHDVGVIVIALAVFIIGFVDRGLARVGGQSGGDVLVFLLIRRFLGGAVGIERRLTVGDRDAVIIGVDFAEGEEAMAITAIFDERRL